MATKAQVIAKLKKQGAEWEIENLDPYTFSAWLPADLVWDNAHQTGMVAEEKDGYGDETWSAYWSYIWQQINHDVIPKP